MLSSSLVVNPMCAFVRCIIGVGILIFQILSKQHGDILLTTFSCDVRIFKVIKVVGAETVVQKVLTNVCINIAC